MGQGLPIGVGVALAGRKLDRLGYRVWVLTGDSELAEGSMWEAFEHAAFAGLVAAATLTRLMSTLLYGITPLDPVTYVAVPLVLMTATVIASYVPARRAASADPVEALKVE